MKNNYLIIFCFFILSGCHTKLIRVNGEKGKKSISLYDKEIDFYLSANAEYRGYSPYRFRINQVFNIKKEKSVILELQELSVKLNDKEIALTNVYTSFKIERLNSTYVSIKYYEYISLYFDNPYQKGDTLRISFGQDYLKYEGKAVPLESVFFIMPRPPSKE